MNFELRIDGKAVVNMELNHGLISGLLQLKPSTAGAETISQSASLTNAQAEELLSRIDGKSVQFLKQIAANNGSITWGEMKTIFSIGDWATFASGHGKGITRALRHMLDDKSARLFWWIDKDWVDDEGNNLAPSEEDRCKVYVDGTALRALREISGSKM
jgi:hypothetical protein